MSSFLVGFLVLLLIYVLLACSLSLLVGHTGIFSMAHAGIYGVGAYTSAIVTVRWEQPFWIGLLSALALGALLSGLMALPSLRVSGDYFIVASLGMQIVVEAVLRNSELTGGEAGFRGIQAPELLGITLRGESYLVFVAALVAVSVLVMLYVTRTPYGRVLHAIRDDQSVALAVGKNVNAYKTSVTMLAGAFAGVAGSLYAHHITFLSPRTFNFSLSIYLFLLLLVGGKSRLGGVVLGTAAIVALPEVLERAFDIPPSAAGPAYQIIFGLLVIVLMFVRPQGLLPTRGRT